LLGYLPRKDKHREDVLIAVQKIHSIMDMTLIIYEAPHRIINVLEAIKKAFGNISIVVSSELTKVFEDTKRGKVEEILSYYSKKKPRGEFVLLFSTKELQKSGEGEKFLPPPTNQV